MHRLLEKELTFVVSCCVTGLPGAM